MIIDVHCHVVFGARPIDPAIKRFRFERVGGVGTGGYDSYFSPRFWRKPGWFFIRRWLGIGPKLAPGAEMDAHIEEASQRHWSSARGVDRLVLLAFDEYHDDAGRAIGPAHRPWQRGSDLYASNSLVRHLCAAHPDRFLFGGSIHPYRTRQGRTACHMLEEIARAGAVLVKWLPIHQNIRADDPRTVAFLRQAARLGVAMLIHYGGEMSLARQHKEFTSPIPMLDVLRQLRDEGAMPTVIVAHAATPSFWWQDGTGHQALIDALLGEFADAPLYADIAALTAYGRRHWLRRQARQTELHPKLLWGSDFPIPVLTRAFPKLINNKTRRRIDALPSWIERSLRMSQAMGFNPRVFTQAAEVLNVS